MRNILRNTIRTTEDFAGCISRIALIPLSKETPYTIHVEPFERNRSLAQNRLFHKWIGVIGDETGNELEAVKSEMKRLFLGSNISGFRDPKTGTMQITASLRSTTELSVKEMSDFMNKVLAWSGEMGIILPCPEDLYWSVNGEK